MEENSTYLWTANDGTSLQYVHYSNEDSDEKGTLLPVPDVLQTNTWNYIAITYNYGEGKVLVTVTSRIDDSCAICLLAESKDRLNWLTWNLYCNP